MVVCVCVRGGRWIGWGAHQTHCHSLIKCPNGELYRGCAPALRLLRRFFALLYAQRFAQCGKERAHTIKGVFAVVVCFAVLAVCVCVCVWGEKVEKLLVVLGTH